MPLSAVICTFSSTTSDTGASGKPTIACFWIKDCGYSYHAMNLLAMLRKRHPDPNLDITGFYLNEIYGDELAEQVSSHGYGNVSVVATQPPVSFVLNLVKTFKVRSPGRDIYIVTKKGLIYTIDIKDTRENTTASIKRIEFAMDNLANG